MPQGRVTVVIVYRAKPGKADAGLRALGNLVATVVAEEAACLGIALHQDLSDPARILLYEEWADKAAYVGPHMQTPHIREFLEKASELFVGPPEKSFWERRAELRRG